MTTAMAAPVDVEMKDVDKAATGADAGNEDPKKDADALTLEGKLKRLLQPIFYLIYIYITLVFNSSFTLNYAALYKWLVFLGY